MIPPLQAMRLRSISRWMQDRSPNRRFQPEELASRAESLDEQMIEAFESREDSLKDSMMKAGTWGTAAGMQQFPMARLTLWQEVVAEFLPPITDPESGG